MGWNPVCDQAPVKGEWKQVKLPMRGVRFAEMNDGEGYLAVRYDKARYIFEGVPRHKYQVLLRHRGASIYFRQQIKNQYPCVDVKIYDNHQQYRVDDEMDLRLEAKRERLAIKAADRPKRNPQMNLF